MSRVGRLIPLPLRCTVFLVLRLYESGEPVVPVAYAAANDDGNWTVSSLLYLQLLGSQARFYFLLLSAIVREGL